jgi:toxin ParE1/3/4
VPLVCKWTTATLRDLEHIDNYIAQDNPAVSVDMTISIVRVVQDQLCHHPHIGRMGRVHRTRELVVSGTLYIVPYRVKNGRIEVLRVFYGAQKWPDHFR